MGFFIGIYALGFLVFAIMFSGILTPDADTKGAYKIFAISAKIFLLSAFWPITIWFTNKL